MLVDNSSSRKTGNARFEGFCIDLVNEIARLRDFSVRFKLVEGGSYGGVDPETGEASGMVKELMEQVQCVQRTRVLCAGRSCFLRARALSSIETHYWLAVVHGTDGLV